MSATSLMVNTCTLTPPTHGQSATGAGMTWSAASATTDVACAIQTQSGYESVRMGREDGQRSFNCYFAASTTIATGYLISAIAGNSITGLSGVTLIVTSPPQDHAGRGTYQMVTAEEIQL